VSDPSGRLLVIDDEDMVRSMLTDVLEALGYAVDAADSGEAAMAEFHAGRYRAVITDLRMPGMSGLDLAERLRQVDGAVPVILLTAGASDLEDPRRETVTIVRKPISLVGLQAAVDAACGAA
jgi:CheY-like chemotaxis protein